jgi:fibronectin-binding autotransporter adhesin
MSIRSVSTNIASSFDLRNNISKSIRVLVVAGGGGGGGSGTRPSGGGGGGGLVDATLIVPLSSALSVIVGAGGAVNAIGTISRFGPIYAIGGGPGTDGAAPLSGATSGGSPAASSLRTPIAGDQGYSGGAGLAGQRGGGGGGAGAAGSGGSSTTGGNGGNGGNSTTPATELTYAGGGGGGGATGGSGGSGGGGAGASTTGSVNAIAGTTNRGGGGGGGVASVAILPAAGGSGVVILRFNSALKITIGSGLTSTTETSGSDTIITITGGTGTVTFS